MKRLQPVFSFFLLLLLAVPSCVEAPSLTVTGLRSFSLTRGGGSEVISFTCNRDWSISSSEPWVQVSPSSGPASDAVVKVTFTAEPNAAYDARTANLTLTAADLTETITITQDAALGLMVSPKTFDLTNAAQTVEVTVQQNVNYLVEIDESCKDWITNGATRGLATDKVVFEIAANTSFGEREGTVTFRQMGGGLQESVIIRQGQNNGLFITTPEYELSNGAHTLGVEVKANVEFEVTSRADWITVVETRALASSEIILSVAANDSYGSRTGIVEVTQTNGDQSGQITVTQLQTDGLAVAPASFLLTNQAQTVEVKVSNNVPYSVVIPGEAADWVSVRSNSQTKALTEDTVVFSIGENTGYDDRETSVTIKQVDGPLAQTVVIRQSQANGLFITTSEYELSNEAHTLDVEVKANVEFEVTSQADWIRYVETKALKPSAITLSVDANESYDSRTGTVAVKQKNGSLSGTITVKQSQSGGLVISPASFDLDNQAQTVEIKVRNNVLFSVVIPEEAAGWVSVRSNTRTKALTEDTVVLSIGANTGYDSRETSITIKQVDGPLAQTAVIRQVQSDGLFITTPEYELSNEAHTLDVEVKANVEYEVTSQADWIRYVETKGLKASAITLSVDANGSYDSRTGTVEVKQKNGSLSGTITVKQSQSGGLVISPASFDLDNQARTVEIKVSNNVPFSVVIPEEAAGWVSVQSNTQTKALTEDTVVLSIGANTGYDSRETSITIKQVDGPLAQTAVIRQGQTDGLFVTTPEYALSNDAHTLNVEVKANVEYEVTSQASWISPVVTKGLSPSTLTLNVSANYSYDSRTGSVVVKQKNGSLSGTITVTQSQASGLFVSPTSIQVTHEAQTVEAEVTNNVPFSVVVPAGAKDWISVQSNTQTKALVKDKVVFSIAGNAGVEARKASVTIKQDDGPLAATLTISQEGGPKPFEGYIVVGYATYWDTTLPDPTFLTHINYAFGRIKDDYEGLEIKKDSRLKTIVALKNTHPHLKVLLSIGGWGAGNFSEMAADATHRANFCKNCAAAVRDYNLDGIDLDWEYPTSSDAGISSSPDDTQNFTQLVKDLRAVLGNDKLLTMASASNSKYVDFPGIIPYLDYVNIMTYDMGKPKNQQHNSGLYKSSMTRRSCDESVQLHEKAGVPYRKMTLGIPFYGHGNGSDYNEDADFNEIFFYGYTRCWDATAKVPYMADADGKMVLTYDDEESVGLKAEYVKQKGLLGAMYWNIEADDANWTLSKAIAGPLLGWTDPGPSPEVETILATNQHVQKYLEEVEYPCTNNPDTDKEYSYSSVVGYPGGGPSENDEELPPTYTIQWTASTSSSQKLYVWEGDWSREYSLSKGVGSQDITNLVPNTTYHWEVVSSKKLVARGSFKTTGLLHQVFFAPNVRNGRDLGGRKGLGGKTVVYHKLYRGGAIHGSRTSSKGKEEMLAEGIRAEVDLREASDVPKQSPLGSSVDFYAPGFDSGYNHMVRDNPDKVKNTFCWVVARLRENKPVYFHCSAGRDRTATLAVLLEGALGVSESDMAKDYELTYFSPADWGMSEDDDGNPYYAHVRTVYSYKSIRKTIFKETDSGTYQERIVKYLLKIGVPQADIDDLRSIMLK